MAGKSASHRNRIRESVLTGDNARAGLEIRIWGIVQGVGFRPFVYRLATELDLAGWVRNDSAGVEIRVEGPPARLMTFLERLQREKPPPAHIYALDHRFLRSQGLNRFVIKKSRGGSQPRAWILPDLALCAACRQELLDPHDRRYRYPFINCTHCGPRFTIIKRLPYDRPHTSMKAFVMCPDCQCEYDDPRDRRFHAQPNACPVCGPRVAYYASPGSAPIYGEEALQRVVADLHAGRIVAVKGLGGFHLLVDATNEEAVAELRRRKRRPRKPFAVMYPDLDRLRRHVHVPDFVEPVLTSAQAPILLLVRTAAGWREIAPSVAPESPYLGVFLPYTPLHVLILNDVGRPVVATSGNVTDDPLVYRDADAFQRLAPLADALLVHDRPIVRHADDSVLHFIQRPQPKLQMLRRARGYVPLPLVMDRDLPPMVALGGHKNVTLAVTRGREILVSQHLGDMDTYEARQTYRRILEDFLRLYDIRPRYVVHDLHPDYFTTALAEELDLPRLAVQHHHAHMAACMAENGLHGPVLGITWDGTGYGPDGTVWGGEFLWGDPRDYRRVATLHPFSLPGGEQAVHEPWRVALALLDLAYDQEAPCDLPLFRDLSTTHWQTVRQMLSGRLRGPLTTSVGRLFDGVSALLGLAYRNTHQAEAAQVLEYAAWRHGSHVKPLPFDLQEEADVVRIDWRPLVRDLVHRFRGGAAAEELAARFHATLVAAALEVVARLHPPAVVLSGGVFCNRWLTEALLEALQDRGFPVFLHHQYPPNDGGLAVGQAWIAVQRLSSAT